MRARARGVFRTLRNSDVAAVLADSDSLNIVVNESMYVILCDQRFKSLKTLCQIANDNCPCHLCFINSCVMALFMPTGEWHCAVKPVSLACSDTPTKAQQSMMFNTYDSDSNNH